MTWKGLNRDFTKKLLSIYSESETEAILKNLFEWASEGNYQLRFRMPDAPVDESIRAILENSLGELLRHTPLQYITREAWFYNLRFFVSPAVLIPRPETEELVKHVLDHLRSLNGQRIIDIGTGSGCVAIAIKTNNTGSNVSAIDVSEDALAVAAKNAVTHKVDIQFSCLDFLTQIIPGKYDVIVSNPPYIPEAELPDMEDNVVAFEPHLALFVPNDDPLIFYCKIAEFATSALDLKGKIFVETHQGLAKNVSALFVECGFLSGVIKDMFGKERFVWATHSR